MLRHHQSFDDLLERVPDEFYHWVETTKRALESEYAARLTAAEKVFADISARSESRKEFAVEAVKQGQMTPLLFALYDQKPVAEIIWKQLKPAAEQPFKEEI